MRELLKTDFSFALHRSRPDQYMRAFESQPNVAQFVIVRILLSNGHHFEKTRLGLYEPNEVDY